MFLTMKLLPCWAGASEGDGGDGEGGGGGDGEGDFTSGGEGGDGGGEKYGVTFNAPLLVRETLHPHLLWAVASSAANISSSIFFVIMCPTNTRVSYILFCAAVVATRAEI